MKLRASDKRAIDKVLYKVHPTHAFNQENASDHFRSASGDEPLRDWLKALGKADRQAIGEDIAYVQYKWPIGIPRVDHLHGSVFKKHSRRTLAILNWQSNA